MTSERIGLLLGLMGVGLCGACGSSTSLSVETDAEVAAGGSTETAGTLGGGVGIGGMVETSGGGSGGAGGESSSHPERTIVSGTVAMETMVGAATESCQQVLRLNNPTQSLAGYLQMGPSAYVNSSKAGEPEYVYLKGGKDAVILPGPSVTYGSTSVDVNATQLTTCVGEEIVCTRHAGYRVKVNERLSYVITIDDWEEEIALGTVELCLNQGTLTTQFVFAGLGILEGGGVAHQLTITPILGGVPGTPTVPVTIECRTLEH